MQLAEKTTLNLVDANAGMAPKNVQVKRIGSELHIGLGDSNAAVPDFVVEDFFVQEGSIFMGQSEPGEYFDYIASEGTSSIAQLEGGGSSLLSLGEASSVSSFLGASGVGAAAAWVAVGSLAVATPVGAYLLGSLVVADATSNTSSGFSSSLLGTAGAASVDATRKVALGAVSIKALAGDNIINASEAGGGVVVSGSKENGTTVMPSIGRLG